MSLEIRNPIFTAAGRGFILDRQPLSHNDMLWRVQATDGQWWYGLWHEGQTEPIIFASPGDIVWGDAPQDCFREFLRRADVELGPVLPEFTWVERAAKRHLAIHGEDMQ
jgi:hypothetical protein